MKWKIRIVAVVSEATLRRIQANAPSIDFEKEGIELKELAVEAVE